MTSVPPTEPGWYPDPWGAAPWRYFDGAAWTPQTHGGPEEQTTGTTGATAAATMPFPGSGPGRIGRTGMVLWAVATVLNAISNTLNAIVLTDYYHTILQRASEGRTGGRAPTPPAVAPLLSLLSLPALAATIGMYVMLIIWMFRIAKNGRAIGIPASLAPGWAIGGWFIPFANIALPCISVVGAAPAHLRGKVIRWWVTLLASSLAVFPLSIASIASFFSGDNTIAIIMGCIVIPVALGLSVLQIFWGFALTREIEAGQAAAAGAAR